MPRQRSGRRSAIVRDRISAQGEHEYAVSWVHSDGSHAGLSWEGSLELHDRGYSNLVKQFEGSFVLMVEPNNGTRPASSNGSRRPGSPSRHQRKRNNNTSVTNQPPKQLTPLPTVPATAADGQQHGTRSQSVLEERESEKMMGVDAMRRRVREYESKCMARLLSKKFNAIQELQTSPAKARRHWLSGVKLATGLDLRNKAGSIPTDATNKRTGGAGVAYDEKEVTALSKRAYEAMKVAQELPVARPGTAEAWREVEELFLQGLEAMGRGREEIVAEILNEEKSRSNITVSKIRWKAACTMVFTMLAIDRQNAELVRAHTQQLIKAYTAVEPIVTSQLHNLVLESNGKLIGLEYKLKSESSLFRKIMSDLDAEREHEDGLNLMQVCEKCFDVLRYTCVLPCSEYVAGVTTILKSLDGHTSTGLHPHDDQHGAPTPFVAAAGDVGPRAMTMAQHRVKNFWGKGDAYQGINSVYSLRLPGSQQQPPTLKEQSEEEIAAAGAGDTLYFELQFHTPESIATKEETCHVSYENFRTAVDQEAKAAAWEEMVSVWDLVPIPKGVLDIPKIYQSEFEFDVSKMTEVEKHLISHRKKLESCCSHIVSEVHTRALASEPSVTTLLEHLVVKHGHELLHEDDNIVMRDRERRLTGELTIRREAVQKLTATHYPARDDELLIRYKGPGEPEPPTAGIYVYGGKIDSIVVHNTVFTQVRVTPPLTYRIEIKSEIYFTVAVQEILSDANAMNDNQLISIDNWFGESESRHRGIEAIFYHVYSSCHFKVIFHTTASYQQSVEMEKALHTLFSASISTQSPAANAPAEGRENDTELKKVQSKAEKEADAKLKAEAEMEKNDKFRRHCALMAMSNNVTVPPRCLTIGEVRYAAVKPRGDGHTRIHPLGYHPPGVYSGGVPMLGAATAPMGFLPTPSQPDVYHAAGGGAEKGNAAGAAGMAEVVAQVVATTMATLQQQQQQQQQQQEQEEGSSSSGFGDGSFVSSPRSGAAAAISSRRQQLLNEQQPQQRSGRGGGGGRGGGRGGVGGRSGRRGGGGGRKAELDGWRISALRRRAIDVGVNTTAIEEADELRSGEQRKAALVALVLAQEEAASGSTGPSQQHSVEDAALRAEMAELSTKTLREMAMEKGGASQEELDQADDQDDHRGAIIELILRVT